MDELLARFGGAAADAPARGLPRWLKQPSPLFLYALALAALAPVGAWTLARWRDGSDDPLGVLALVALFAWAWRERAALDGRPRAGWLWGAVAGVALAAFLQPRSPLLGGVAGVLGLASLVLATRQRGQPLLAATGLAVLALPLLSSLQFFAGYPLRVLTAEASRLLLAAAGVAAEREGTALAIGGRLVMVDAPCSGVHMAWMAYFSACLVAAWMRLPDRRLMLRWPVVGLTVLVGNVLRNTVLVASEAQGPLATWQHEAIGGLTYALVCAAVLWLVGRPVPPAVSSAPPSKLRTRARTLGFAELPAAIALASLAVWNALASPPAAAPSPTRAVEWPRTWEGRALRPLALSPVEHRFAERFPGAIARFDLDGAVLVMRQVERPTRRLHPAADCYRGLGYRVTGIALVRRADGRLWRCFAADKDGARLRVCEHIVDAAGRVHTDTSAWYWAAASGASRGPWSALTLAEPR